MFAPDQVHRLGKLKKTEIASEAERLAVGMGWLPAMFRVQEATVETQSVPESGANADVESSDAAGAEVQEGEHATA